MYFNRVSVFAMGGSDGRLFSISAICSSAAQISSTLCGGMLVAMPTAMPAEPLASRLGKRAGSTTGSSSDPS
jgi:hypothetical protein